MARPVRRSFVANAWRRAGLTLLLLGAAAVSGCAVSKEARVRAALVDAGVPRPVAVCMADIMAEDLSTAQLRALRDAVATARRPVGEISINDALKILRTVGEPTTIGVIALASTSCIGRL